MLNKPLKHKDTDVMMVLVIGLYQLKYLAIPDHAAISESVELAKKLKKEWAAGLVNGVLRHYQREGQSVESKLEKSLQFQFSHPGWMVKRIRQDWPEQADDLLQANNQQAPMILRVNTIQISRDDYLQRLNQMSIRASVHPVAPDALVLESALEVTQLPGFSEGLVTVQDAAAQLAVEMLDLQPGMNVLDGLRSAWWKNHTSITTLCGYRSYSSRNVEQSRRTNPADVKPNADAMRNKGS